MCSTEIISTSKFTILIYFKHSFLCKNNCEPIPKNEVHFEDFFF